MNRNWLFTGILATAISLPCVAQPALDADKLSLLKRSTVLIQDTGRNLGGSGFVVAVQGEQVFCVTNAHVVVDHRGPSGTLEVVLDSGSPAPRRSRAQVVCSDESDDLAVVSFSLQKPPAPVPLSSEVDVPETTPVFVFGFPFGEGLAARGGTPAVTVSRASVSAKRRDAGGLVEALQLDGEINPGNSGGPIVNAEGKAVGVATAKVGGTNISFGIPIQSVQSLLNGRPKGIHFGEAQRSKDAVEMDVEVTLLDPLRQVTSVTLLTGSSEKQAGANAGNPGEFKPMVGAREFKLKIEGYAAKGRIKHKTVSTAKPNDLFQLKLTSKNGGTTYTVHNKLPVSDTNDDQEAPGAAKSPAKSKAGDREPPEDFGPPPTPLDAEKSIKLPSEIAESRLAGGGRYLVLKLRDMPSLAVVDLFSGEIVKHIRMSSEDFDYAAGGNTILVYLPAENILQTFDLTTLERRKSKPNPLGAAITDMTMGYGRGGRALVRYTKGREEHAQTALGFLDTNQLEPIEIPVGDGKQAWASHNSSKSTKVHQRANRDLGIITEWATSHSPGGVNVWVRRGTTYDFRYEHNSDGYLAAGDDGRVYCFSGRIYTGKIETFGQLDGQRLIPGVGGSTYLGVSSDGKMTIYECGKTTPLCPFGEFPGWKSGKNEYEVYRDELQLDQRIVFAPNCGRIVFLPPDNTTVLVRNFDLKAVMDASDIDYLVVRSTVPGPARVGKDWTYQIDAISRAGGLTYSLELAPDGMNVTPEGLVSWKPKKPTGEQGETVVILIKDSSGEETYHKFQLPVATK